MCNRIAQTAIFLNITILIIPLNIPNPLNTSNVQCEIIYGIFNFDMIYQVLLDSIFYLHFSWNVKLMSLDV